MSHRHVHPERTQGETSDVTWRVTTTENGDLQRIGDDFGKSTCCSFSLCPKMAYFPGCLVGKTWRANTSSGIPRGEEPVSARHNYTVTAWHGSKKLKLPRRHLLDPRPPRDPQSHLALLLDRAWTKSGITHLTPDPPRNLLPTKLALTLGAASVPQALALEGTFARRVPGAPNIQMTVPTVYYNALPPNITRSSSPGTLSTSTLYDCWQKK